MNFTNDAFWNNFWSRFTSEINAIERRNGFSYEIPKEEQVRSSLYSYLREFNALVEIEHDIRKKGSKRVVGEIDLRLLDVREDLLIEIKRHCSLQRWSNKHTEALKNWKKDIEKLNSIKTSGSKRFRRCFFLIIFSHTDKILKKAKVADMNAYILESWGPSTIFVELKKTNFGKKNAKYCSGYVWIED